MRFLIFVSIFICATAPSFAQDIHWSQFNANPVFQNPGNTGHFNGDVRFVGNFRDQWRSVSRPFQTLNISVDGKPMNYRNFGIGGLMFHDVSGDGNFRTIELQANASYLFKITSDSTHVIRPGINIGMNHRQINWNALKFGNQFNGQQYDPSLPNDENYITDRKTNFTVGVGAIYEFNLEKRKKFSFGISSFNLNKPNQGFYQSKIQRDVRTNLFLSAMYPLADAWDILPSAQFNLQGKYRELVVGTSAKYTLINKLGKYRAVYAGLWYRSKDAGFISVGMDYQSWFVGLSYDVNFSKLAVASNARGGMEFAIRYIIHRFKPKKVVHRICPDYI